MRQAIRAIVIRDSKLLVMHRNKFGKEYYTLPGGNVEIGETLEEALYREIAEETSITMGKERMVFIEDAGEPYGKQFIYLCEYISGEPKLQPGSEEDLINKMGNNKYTPQWLELRQLAEEPFVSEGLKARILDCVERGWPEKALEFSSKDRYT